MSLAKIRLIVVSMLAAVAAPVLGFGGDWPLWRFDAQRSAASPAELPQQLRLHWVRRLPPLKPAWPDQPKMQFDIVYEPIVVGQRLILGSSFDNSITAYDTRTGSELWRFFTQGPVRFAPAAWNDKLYAVSDDGYLYCLQARDGTLLWRFRGGPSDRQILGNERLISTWPAHGAPVVVDGKVYFAAGIWPFMGIFLHALDAETGRVVWTNDGDGSIYIKQPHNSDSFAGVAPQGPLVAIGDQLLVPGGRSVPACYDRLTGKMLYYQLNDNGKRGGGSTAGAVDQLMLNGGTLFDLANESPLGVIGEQFTFADGMLHDYRNEHLRTIDLNPSNLATQEVVDRKGEKTIAKKWTINELGRVKSPRLTALIKSGSRLYAGNEGSVSAFAIPLPKEGPAKPIWQIDIEGVATSLVAADDRLFAVTLDGSIYCFGDADRATTSPQHHELAKHPLTVDDKWSAKAESLLKSTSVHTGYCVVWGLGTGELVSALAVRSELQIVVIEPDANKANSFRNKMHDAGIGAERVAVLIVDPLEVALPPYLASLSVAEKLPESAKSRDAIVSKIFAGLRPFGGAACLPVAAQQIDQLSQTLPQANLANAVWKSAGDMALLIREGALPESANWTHEHADAANTRVSKDRLVKTPLGLLWFGGPSNDGILPRHGHGPQPQVVDGRLFIEGIDLLRALDIYTGRVLWEAPLPGLGKLYEVTIHQPGANASGTNYIATSQGIYVAHGPSCFVLDPATGARVAEFKLPPTPGAETIPLWGYINVMDDYLVGGADPLFDPSLARSGSANDNYSSSQRLVVLNRTDGQPIWTATATSGFRHNGICLGGGRMYCIDRLSGAQLSRFKRRGEMPVDTPRLVVFDLKNGQKTWEAEKGVFGTWLSYSAEHDVLVEAGRVARDTLSDEPKGMRAYRASDGTMLWEDMSYTGPAMIHHESILMAGTACDLLTGKQRMREHPLSGEPVEWSWSRNYGCNTPLASEHLLTFRSGAAGYFDFCNDGGTGNFGGFRSSCTNNLIVAGGVLNAPDYTRTCTCSYQNQTSLALIHMPEVETWTSFGAQTPKQPVRRVGINLGAPGDRKATDGTLWLEYPSVGGSSPAVSVTIDPPEPVWFRRHSSTIEGPGISWVAASGAKGLKELRIKLAASDSQPHRYTVRLHFVEPDDLQVGDRVFDVTIQGTKAVADLDVFKEAGGRNRSWIKEIAGIEASETLKIELTSEPGAKEQATILCGVEIQAEGW